MVQDWWVNLAFSVPLFCPLKHSQIVNSPQIYLPLPRRLELSLYAGFYSNFLNIPFSKMHRFFCLCLSNQPQYFTKNDTAHLCNWNQLNVERQIRLWREAQGHNNSELANNFCRFFCLTTSLTRRPPEIKSIFGSDWSSWPPAALSTTWKGHCSWKTWVKKEKKRHS